MLGKYHFLIGKVAVTPTTSPSTESTSVIRGANTGSSAADIDLALIPKGLGALTANLPDGTSIGGNARGDNAIDLEMVRASPI